MKTNPLPVCLLLALLGLHPAPAQSPDAVEAPLDPLPVFHSKHGVFKLGKRPYPAGTRAQWIAEGRALARAPEGYFPRGRTVRGAANNSGYLPPIGDQGAEGSCVHWAGTYHTKTATMKRLDPALNITANSNKCSPRFTYNLTNAGADNGGFGHEPFEIFMRYGTASLAQKPYVAGQYTTLPVTADFLEGLHRRSTNYVWVWDWDPDASQITELKQYLDAGGVAACAVYAEGTFDAWSSGDAPWVGPSCTYDDMNHMVTVCGYGSGWYLIANSWGASYGSNGFIYVNANYFENYFSDVMYPLEGAYTRATNYAKFTVRHTQRSDIRELLLTVNGANVWSNSPLPKSLPKGTGDFDTDSRDNLEVAIDLSHATWNPSANVVTARCIDRVSSYNGTVTVFNVVYNGAEYVSPSVPVRVSYNAYTSAWVRIGADTETNVLFSGSSANVGENAGAYTVTVHKTRASGDISGQIGLSGTATEGAGADYTISGTNFTLNGATTSATFTVTIHDDADEESAETIVLTLANVAGGTIAAPSVFTLTIAPSDLTGGSVLISQYTETESGTTPKGLELWNASASDLVFNGTDRLLDIKIGVNGAAPASTMTISNGTLAAGDVWVIGTSDMTPDLVKAFTFNGDDAIVIELGGVVQDVFGNPGSDPGSDWNGNGVSTANQNIQLKAGITFGDTDGWTDPSERFETVGAGSVLTGFGEAPGGAPPADSPPVLQPIGAKSVTVSNTLQFTVTATPTDGDAVELTASNLPPGAVFYPTNEVGSFLWTNASPTGAYHVTFNAADKDGADAETVTITVAAGAAGGETYAETFDTLAFWGGGAAGSYTTKFYTNDTEAPLGDAFAASNAVRETNYAVTGYAWRLGNESTPNVYLRYVVTTNIQRIAVDLARWDNSPTPNFTIRYSVDGGSSYTTLFTNNGSWFAEDKAYKTYDSGAIALSPTPGQSLWIEVLRSSGERLLVDNFEVDYGGTGAPPADSPPVLQPIGAKSVTVSNTLQFTVTATPTDGDAVELTASNLPPGAVFYPTNEVGSFLWTNASPTGAYHVTFNAADKDGADAETVTITVSAGAAGGETLDLGGWKLVQSNATKTLTFPEGTLVEPGGYVIVARKNTRAGFEAAWGVTLGDSVVFLNSGDVLPQINGAETYTLLNGAGVLADGTTPSSLNPSSSSIQRTSLAGAASEEGSWTKVGMASATPGTGAAGGGTAGLRISEYSDATGWSNEFVELFYDVSAENRAPVLAAIGHKAVIWSNTLSFSVSAADTVDGDEIVLSATGLPPGASFATVTNAGGVTNTFSWPDAGPLGVYTTTFWAVDKDGSDSETVAITVSDGSEPVLIAFQGFEGTPQDTWGIAAADFIRSTPGVNDTPANQRVRTGSYSWQPGETDEISETLELDAVDVSAYSDVVMTLHLSATCTNIGDGYGLWPNDTFGVFLGLDGGAYPGAADLTVQGNTLAGNSITGVLWGYTATGLAATTAGVSRTLSAASGGIAADGLATVRVALPPGAVSVRLKAVSSLEYYGYYWNVDDISLEGRADGGAADYPPSIALDPAGTSKTIAVGSPLTFNVLGSEIPNDAADTITLRAANLPDGATFPEVSGPSVLTNAFQWTPAATGTVVVSFFAGDKDGTNQLDVTIRAFEQLPVGTYRAVICGISDYEGTINDLEYCDDDAQALYDLLAGSSNWFAENIQLLLNTTATKANIQAAIAAMGAASAPGDVNLFYFSGHGGGDLPDLDGDEGDGYDEYLCPFNLMTEEIADDELGEWLGALPTDNIVVLLDTCHSGGHLKAPVGARRTKGVSRIGLNVVPVNGFADDLRRKGRLDSDDLISPYIQTAADYDEYSYEDGDLAHGIYTYFLLSALSNADANVDGWVAGEESFDDLYPKVVAYESTQHPQEYDGWSGLANIVTWGSFSGPSNQPPTITFAPAGTNHAVALHGHLALTVTATEPDGEEVSLTASNLPAGAFFYPTNKTGSFVWTDAGPTGTYRVTFNAADTDGFGEKTIQIRVLAVDTNCTVLISEYVEGTSNNKAIELYNPGPDAIDLAAGSYVLRLSINGGSSSANINLAGTVPAGGTHVITHSDAGAALLALANQTSGNLTFNGDDALILYSGGVGGTVLDSFGQVGVDPGDYWGTLPSTTKDHTLRRKASILRGDTVLDDAFDPTAEWDILAADVFDGLGEHVNDCGGAPVEDPDIVGFAVPAGATASATLVSESGRSYSLQYTTDLGANPVVWTQADTETGDGGVITLSDPDPADAMRIYRVVSP